MACSQPETKNPMKTTEIGRSMERWPLLHPASLMAVGFTMISLEKCCTTFQVAHTHRCCYEGTQTSFEMKESSKHYFKLVSGHSGLSKLRSSYQPTRPGHKYCDLHVQFNIIIHGTVPFSVHRFLLELAQETLSKQ